MRVADLGSAVALASRCGASLTVRPGAFGLPMGGCSLLLRGGTVRRGRMRIVWQYNRGVFVLQVFIGGLLKWAETVAATTFARLFEGNGPATTRPCVPAEPRSTSPSRIACRFVA